ncbi:MAG TPA: hypothetical protein VF510_00665 [Ktedonobacterales bacterium]
MSDEARHDDWLTPDPLHGEEARRSDELEQFLVAALMHGEAGSDSRPDGELTALLDSRVSEEWLANRLIGLGDEILPDDEFAAGLQAQIEQRIGEGSGNRRGSDGITPNGEAGSSNGQPRPQHGTRFRRRVHRFRPLWAALAAMVLLTVLLALPPVQASLRRPLCLGSVCIVFDGAPRPAATGSPQASPTSTPLPSVLDLAGRTTLAQARAQAKFPVRLPAYPADLGQPDYVFLQNLDGAAVVLVWVDHEHPDRVRLTLSELSSGIYVYKFTSSPVAVTTVHGQQALWTTGPYMVQVQDGTYDQRRFVDGHALIWSEGNMTYRLETSASLDEAVRIAESLR